MDVIIPNSWLKKYLDTKAKPNEVAKYLSLCGPSIERIKKTEDGDSIYSIEVTTNRVDTASVLGIAREAAVILTNFGLPSKFKEEKLDDSKFKFIKKVKYLDVKVDSNLCSRFTAVLIRDVKVKESPKEVSTLLEKVGVRPINNIVDISNYIMHELGQPVHTFDYDKIVGSKMILRESNKNETVVTLDGKEFKLNGGDIVIEDGSGKLIDLCGIMGGKNSAIDENTKNVLLFVQNYNQHKIRKTSMSLAQRSEAAVLFEKGLDSENVKPAIISAINMIEKLSGGKSEFEIIDIYPKPYKTKFVSTTKDVIDRIIGISISQKDINRYLTSLGFEVIWNDNQIKVSVPSYRANDIDIPEDLAEEIARIYGYHNLPAILMDGPLPKPSHNTLFKIETQIKQTLSALGATEIYNLSLVSKNMVGENALRLKNPLGSDTEYLRTSLRPSLISNIKDNPQEKGTIHIFEVANIYIRRKGDLPEEKLTLSGILKGSDYRINKGIVESLMDSLSINYSTKIEDGNGYLPNQRMEIISNKKTVGEYGNLENNLFYYQFDIQALIDSSKIIKKYMDVAKFPPQVEDITLIVPEKTLIGDVIKSIKLQSDFLTKVELKDIYESSYTFNIEYQSKDKTLTDDEVKKIRTKVILHLKTNFGIITKE